MWFHHSLAFCFFLYIIFDVFWFRVLEVRQNLYNDRSNRHDLLINHNTVNRNTGEQGFFIRPIRYNEGPCSAEERLLLDVTDRAGGGMHSYVERRCRRVLRRSQSRRRPLPLPWRQIPVPRKLAHTLCLVRPLISDTFRAENHIIQPKIIWPITNSRSQWAFSRSIAVDL